MYVSLQSECVYYILLNIHHIQYHVTQFYLNFACNVDRGLAVLGIDTSIVSTGSVKLKHGQGELEILLHKNSTHQFIPICKSHHFHCQCNILK
jgi:hypothetical protein